MADGMDPSSTQVFSGVQGLLLHAAPTERLDLVTTHSNISFQLPLVLCKWHLEYKAHLVLLVYVQLNETSLKICLTKNRYPN
jgi:hypothetical protein